MSDFLKAHGYHVYPCVSVFNVAHDGHTILTTFDGPHRFKNEADAWTFASNHWAWLFAASWGSAMHSGDPGACLYGFSEDFRVQTEEHRADCIREMQNNRAYVVLHPEDYDADELDQIDTLIAKLQTAEIAA
jgi:hypothetical protein